jgi:large subunit ribosomal protein L9
LGTIPTEHNLRLLDRYKVRVLQAREARIADIKALADQISKFSGITIESRANAENQLYGSVGSAEIAAGLKAKGYPIEAEMVVLEGAIRETGLFGVKLNLGFSIETEVKVAVVSLADKR